MYAGDFPCNAPKKDGSLCTNAAYYKNPNGTPACGTHSKKGEREDLPKNPDAKDIIMAKIAAHDALCISVAASNKNAGLRGNVICHKMLMMKNPGFVNGYHNVFPNYKHGGRSDGLGIPSLSPKSMGPIHHGQPGLPPATNLENFHQGNKVFPGECDSAGYPLPIFFTTQIAMYNDPTPHRHKETSGGSNIPVYSVWVDKTGTKHMISYIESRQFYCKFYERFARVDPHYLFLLESLADGHNIRICGYDAHSTDGKTLDAWYHDDSVPFGHEMVLYTMLTVENPNDYPWNKAITYDF
jgi:hypothetical protein